MEAKTTAVADAIEAQLNYLVPTDETPYSYTYDPPPGVAAVALEALAGGAGPAMASPGRWLREAGRMLARGQEPPAARGPDHAGPDAGGS